MVVDSLESTSKENLQRRQEILRRTRMGLREDLDDLRDELADTLDEFESRLSRTARHLPRWLDLPDNSLRVSFELRAPDLLQGVLMGPRTVAMVASEVERFLLEWLGAEEEEFPLWIRRDEEGAVEAMTAHLDELQKTIGDAIEAVTFLADEGPLELEQILESIVFELETRRETDVEALESLIQGGDVEAGRAAQVEIAELWEEQRRRAGQLQRVWDDLLAIHHEGITRTLSGIEELQELVGGARQGIEGADLLVKEPPPAAEPEEQEFSDEDEAEEEISDADEDCDPAAPAEPPPAKSSADISGEISTNPFLRAPSEAEEVEESGAQDAESEARTESDETDETDDEGVEEEGKGQEDALEHVVEAACKEQSEETRDEISEEAAAEVEEVGPTLPMMDEVAAMAAADAASAELENDEEDEEIAIPETSAELLCETIPDGAATRDSLEVEQSAPDQRVEIEVFDDESMDLAEAEDLTESATDTDSDRIRLRSFRIRDGWQVVTGGDIAATLGPPGLFVAALLVLCLLSLVGFTENPMVLWDWAFPATYAAMALLVVLPLLLRWRPMWRGHRFSIIRRGEVEEEVDLRLTETKLYFDRTSWKIEDLSNFEINRWESPLDEACGWLLTIDPPYQTPFDLVTFEVNEEAWKKSRIPRVEPPHDAWQIPPEEFHIICDILEGRST